MIEKDPKKCKGRSRIKDYIKAYAFEMKQRGVQFDYSNNDKELFEKTKEQIGPEGKFAQGKVHNYALSEFSPIIYNVWNFNGFDERFGIEKFEGRIPGQLVQNALYYFTNEGDVVVDPMAGSGTTYDVCVSMKRTPLCYDIAPKREEILKHDIREGFPEATKDCDLIFLDPPYFNMVFENQKTIEEFYGFIEGLAKSSFETVKKGGIVALLMQDMTEKGNYCLSGESYILFRRAGFSHLAHVSCPLSTEQFIPQQVERAKKEKRMLGRNRDLYVFQKV